MTLGGGTAVATGKPIAIVAPHAGQRQVIPACSSRARSVFPHLHVTTMGIVIGPSYRPCFPTGSAYYRAVAVMSQSIRCGQIGELPACAHCGHNGASMAKAGGAKTPQRAETPAAKKHPNGGVKKKAESKPREAVAAPVIPAGKPAAADLPPAAVVVKPVEPVQPSQPAVPTPAPVPQPPLLFEIGWEVCWQLGGIYTVLRSKADAMIDRW